MQIEPVSWNGPDVMSIGGISEIHMESYFNNTAASELLEQKRKHHENPNRKLIAKSAAEEKTQFERAIDPQWSSWVLECELLRNHIKRGQECLEQVRTELAAARTELEDWPAYEQICGVNPLREYFQEIAAKEQIAKFLPGWLRRQENKLQNLKRKMNRLRNEKATNPR
jgi:hypothetical protein